MMHIRSFPRSAAYLKASGYNLDDPSMTPYWWSVCLADAFTDEELEADGKVDFAAKDGDAIMPELERLLVHRPSRKRSAVKASESFKAFFGSRGVKVSSLRSPRDFRDVAAILWPHTITAETPEDIRVLESLIKSMSKVQRRTASVNIKAVPVKWRGGRAA
jgi:hypothetical protein